MRSPGERWSPLSPGSSPTRQSAPKPVSVARRVVRRPTGAGQPQVWLRTPHCSAQEDERIASTLQGAPGATLPPRRRLDPPEPCAVQRRRCRARTPRSPARHGPLTRKRRFGSRAPHCRTPPRGGCLAPGAPLQPAAGNPDGLSPAATCQAPRGFQVARARPKEEGSTTSPTTQGYPHLVSPSVAGFSAGAITKPSG